MKNIKSRSELYYPYFPRFDYTIEIEVSKDNQNKQLFKSKICYLVSTGFANVIIAYDS